MAEFLFPLKGKSLAATSLSLPLNIFPMKSQVFTMTEGSEFIPLDKLLKLCRLVNSGGEAHAFIMQGAVRLNGEIEMQKRKKIRVGDKVEFNGEQIAVQA